MICETCDGDLKEMRFDRSQKSLLTFSFGNHTRNAITEVAEFLQATDSDDAEERCALFGHGQLDRYWEIEPSGVK